MTSLNEFLAELRQHVKQLMACSACSSYLLDRDMASFFTVDAGGNECRIPSSPDTVIGHVALKQTLVRVADLYKAPRQLGVSWGLTASQDPRFSHAARGREGEDPVRMLCCPIVTDRRVTGVIQSLQLAT